MARIVKLDETQDLGLPGRISRQILPTTDLDTSLTLRYVEIPVPEEGAAAREPHVHNDCEECIHVLAGSGQFRTKVGAHAISSGDTVLVPRGESHVTDNTGKEPLRLLCYFPVGSLANHG